MNRLPLTTVSVIITGNGPESYSNKNRVGGKATRKTLENIFAATL